MKKIKNIQLSSIITAIFLLGCGDQKSEEELGVSNQIVLEITDDVNPLNGTKLYYSPKTFLIDATPSLEHSPDQGPILYDHIELSPRVFVGPITDMIDRSYPLNLTLPIDTQKNTDGIGIYVLGWGDDGWVQFETISQTKKSVTIEITEILYDPFVAVRDK